MLKNQNENHENSKHQISNIKWFDKPFDRLTVLSKIEGLITLSQPVESLWVERQAQADQVSGRMEVSVFSVQICASMFLFPDTRNLTPETLRFGAGVVFGHLKAGYP